MSHRILHFMMHTGLKLYEIRNMRHIYSSEH